MVPRSPLLACVIRQYGTGLYRTCVSLDSNNTICLSTHPDEASATAMINRFLEIYQKGEIKTAEDVLFFINSTRVEDPDLPHLINIPLPVTERNVHELAA